MKRNNKKGVYYNIKKIVFIVLMMMSVNVLAYEGEVPLEFVVKNKNGAVCYEMDWDESNNPVYYKKEKTEIKPYGTTVIANEEMGHDYIMLDNMDDNCFLDKKDVKIKNSEFNLNNESAHTYDEPTKAVILASSLNIRKGPSKFYSSIGTIPRGEVVTIYGGAGSWWFYTEYKGKRGWIYNYLGFDDPDIIYSIYEIPIYDKNGKEIGKIPPLTEVTDYLSLPSYESKECYVIYNGIKGYISGYEGDPISFKVEGKIRLLKDTELYRDDKVIKIIKKGTELEYSISNQGTYYIPKENGIMELGYEDYEDIGEEIFLVKNRGYIGEGLFGEEKTKEVDNRTNEQNTPTENLQGNNYQLVIIWVLGSIILVLILVIIVILNNKKKIEEK